MFRQTGQGWRMSVSGGDSHVGRALTNLYNINRVVNPTINLSRIVVYNLL